MVCSGNLTFCIVIVVIHNLSRTGGVLAFCIRIHGYAHELYQFCVEVYIIVVLCIFAVLLDAALCFSGVTPA